MCLGHYRAISILGLCGRIKFGKKKPEKEELFKITTFSGQCELGKRLSKSTIYNMLEFTPLTLNEI